MTKASIEAKKNVVVASATSCCREKAIRYDKKIFQGMAILIGDIF